MTYPYSTELPTTAVEAFSTDADFQDLTTREKLKMLQQEGTERSQQIGKILQTAWVETLSEVKAGHRTISPLATALTTEAVSAAKETSQQVSDTIHQTWQAESQAQTSGERLVNVLSSLIDRLVDRTKQVGSAHLLPELKQQVSRLDDLLRDRYGDRYETLRAQLARLHTVIATFDNGADSGDVSSSPTAQPTVTIEGETIEVDSEVVR